MSDAPLLVVTRRPRGRPRAAQPLSAPVTTRFSVEHFDTLDRIARHQRKSIAEVVRSIVEPRLPRRHFS